MRYYEHADRVRAIVGDRFERHLRREAARERVLLIASGLFMATLVVAFLAVAGQ